MYPFASRNGNGFFVYKKKLKKRKGMAFHKCMKCSFSDDCELLKSLHFLKHRKQHVSIS